MLEIWIFHEDAKNDTFYCVKIGKQINFVWMFTTCFGKRLILHLHIIQKWEYQDREREKKNLENSRVHWITVSNQK